jgi:hypothetical protein
MHHSTLLMRWDSGNWKKSRVPEQEQGGGGGEGRGEGLAKGGGRAAMTGAMSGPWGGA